MVGFPVSTVAFAAVVALVVGDVVFGVPLPQAVKVVAARAAAIESTVRRRKMKFLQWWRVIPNRTEKR